MAATPTTLERVTKVIVEQIGSDDDPITDLSRFVADLGCDGLDLTEIGFAIEEEFGLVLEFDIPETATVGEIATLLDTMQGGGQGR